MDIRNQSATGFTLIELVAVIVLLSILSVAVLSRLGGLDTFEQKAFSDEVTNAFRYAQKLAMSTGCNVRVSLTSTSYLLQQGTNCTPATYRNVLNPADRSSAYQGTVPGGVTISSNPSVSSLQFTAQSTVTGLTVNTVFSVGSYSFTLYKNTGLVDAN